MRGLGLVELLLISGASLAVVGGGIALYHHTHKQHRAVQGVEHVRAIAQGVSRAFGTTGSYAGLSTEGAQQAGAFPLGTPLDQNPGSPTYGRPLSVWGTATQVAAEPWNGVADSAFSITYTGVPAADCAKVSSNVGKASAIIINGRTAEAFDPGTLTALCTQENNTTKFILGGNGGLAANGGPALQTCIAPAPETQAVACPAGQIANEPPSYSPNGVHQKRDASCPDPYAPSQWGSWYETNRTCAPICTAPPTATRTSTPCPSGQTGVITEQQTYSCQTPVGPVLSSAWTQIANTCSPTCATRLATAPWKPNPQTSTRATPCPSGQLSTSNQSGTNTAVCSNPGAAADPVWGGWVWTGGSCAPQCVAPAPGTDSQWAGCPGGQVTSSGATAFIQTRPVTYSCPAPTGAYTTAYGGWSPAAGSVCAPQCVAAAPQTQSVGCPAGQSGVINQRRDSYCPAPQGGYSWGGWYETGRSCAPTSGSFYKTVAGCGYESFYSGAGGNSGACTAANGAITWITDPNYWNSWAPGWDSTLDKSRSICSLGELIDKYFYGRNPNCVESQTSPQPPATCTKGTTYYWAQVYTRLDCGQSGQIQDCGTDDNQVYEVYVCQ